MAALGACQRNDVGVFLSFSSSSSSTGVAQVSSEFAYPKPYIQLPHFPLLFLEENMHPDSPGSAPPPPAGNPHPGLTPSTLHRAPVGQGPSGPDWLAISFGFWSGRALATGTAWAGLCVGGGGWLRVCCLVLLL